jgi:hypothetical protein
MPRSARRRGLRPLEKGADAAGINRSRDGKTTKILAVVDAPGLPKRCAITPRHWGLCPLARGLVQGLSGLCHVSADAAYIAEHLRCLMADSHVAKAPGSSRTQAAQSAIPSTGIFAQSTGFSNVSSTGSNASGASRPRSGPIDSRRAARTHARYQPFVFRRQCWTPCQASHAGPSVQICLPTWPTGFDGSCPGLRFITLKQTTFSGGHVPCPEHNLSNRAS